MPRPRAWADTLIDVPFTSSGAANNQDLLLTLTPSDTITVMRLVIHLTVGTQNFSDADDGATFVDMGIGVAAAEAFNVGSTALPDPNQAGDVPARGWLWRDRMVHIEVNTTAPVITLFHISEVRADIRAMRKVDRGILYLRMVAAEQSVGDFVPTNVTGIVRALVAT